MKKYKSKFKDKSTNKETTDCANSANIFLVFLVGWGIILNFHLSFCFLNFGILFAGKTV